MAIASVAAVAWLALTSLASAQDATPARSDADAALVFVDTAAVRLTPDEALRLRSIDGESSWSSGLYVGSVIAIALGGPAALLGGVLCPLSGSSSDGACVAAAIGGVAGGLGLIALGFAIGLDVDSGSRRHRLLDSVRVRLAFSPQGLRIDGSF